MTNLTDRAREIAGKPCNHQYVRVTLSSWRDAPYDKCPRCGHIRECLAVREELKP